MSIFKPHQYQIDAVNFILENRSAGIFADPGLGKTAIILQIIKFLKTKPEFCGALVVAPLRVIYTVWPDEIKKWINFNDITYNILHGKNKQIDTSDYDVSLINSENIFWYFKNEIKQNVLIIDESSKFKNHNSKRFKLIKKFLDCFKRRIILTGTPTPNSLLDLYSQIYILDKGKSLGKGIMTYRNNYFNTVEIDFERNCKKVNFKKYELKKDAKKIIYKKINPIVLRIDSKKYLNLPKIIYNNIKIVLPTEALKVYKNFEKKLFSEIENKPVFLDSASDRYIVCRQIANGFLYKPKDFTEILEKNFNKSVYELHKEKIKALVDLISELNGKSLLIAYHYKYDLKMLRNELGQNTPNIGSGTDMKCSTDIISDWNNGKIPVLLGHPQSMGHGLNLQYGGNDIVWYSLTDNLENYIQFNHRIYRQGNKNQVRVHHIIAKNTIDEAVLIRLQIKNKNQLSLLEALQEYRNGSA